MASPTRSKTTRQSAAELRRQHALLEEVAHMGLFRHGTLLAATNRCGNPGCRCHAEPPQLHGPYWQWTRKVKGKTVTIRRLSDEQVELLQTWIANARRLDKLIVDLEKLSTKITDRLLAAASSRQ